MYAVFQWVPLSENRWGSARVYRVLCPSGDADRAERRIHFVACPLAFSSFVHSDSGLSLDRSSTSSTIGWLESTVVVTEVRGGRWLMTLPLASVLSDQFRRCPMSRLGAVACSSQPSTVGNRCELNTGSGRRSGETRTMRADEVRRGAAVGDPHALTKPWIVPEILDARGTAVARDMSGIRIRGAE